MKKDRKRKGGKQAIKRKSKEEIEEVREKRSKDRREESKTASMQARKRGRLKST